MPRRGADGWRTRRAARARFERPKRRTPPPTSGSKRGWPLSVLLNAALEGRGGLDAALSYREVAALPADRAFARAVAMAALRRLGEIDQILDRRLQKAPPAAVRTILRIAPAQTLVLETPAFAAVSTAVKLTERDAKTRPYKGLVNAVLRGIDRDGPGLTTADSNLLAWIAPPLARHLWRGPGGAPGLAAREEPPTDLSLKPSAVPPLCRRRSRAGPARRHGPHLASRRRFVLVLPP